MQSISQQPIKAQEVPPTSAGTSFFPNPDQSAVSHLFVTVSQVNWRSPTAISLYILCGMGFSITISGKNIPDYQPGDRLVAEFPKENNPLNTTFTALYPISMKPKPMEDKPVIDVTPVADSSELIPIGQGQIGGTTVQTVNARELHAYLEIGKDFSTWIKDRIEQYDFLENQDFVCSPVLGSEGRGGHNRKDYHLSLDMAKELSMVERNQKGKEARQYFIECERQAKSGNLDPMKMLNDPAVLRQTLLGYSEKVLALENKVQEQAPKVQAHDRIAVASGAMTIRETATTLEYPERKLVLWLIQNNWAYRRNGRKNLLGYAEMIKKGWLAHKVRTVEDVHTGEEKISEQLLVTPLGLTVLAQKLTTPETPAGLIPRSQNRYLAARG